MVHLTDALKEAIKADKTIVTDYIHPHSLNSGTPIDKILPPKLGGEFPIDDAVKEGTRSFYHVIQCRAAACEEPPALIQIAFPIPGTTLKTAYHYGSSLWGLTAKLVAELPDGTQRPYFLKVG